MNEVMGDASQMPRVEVTASTTRAKDQKIDVLMFRGPEELVSRIALQEERPMGEVGAVDGLGVVVMENFLRLAAEFCRRHARGRPDDRRHRRSARHPTPWGARDRGPWAAAPSQLHGHGTSGPVDSGARRGWLSGVSRDLADVPSIRLGSGRVRVVPVRGPVLSR